MVKVTAPDWDRQYNTWWWYIAHYTK